MKKRIASLFMAIVMIATLGIGAVAANQQQTLVQGNTTGLSAANFKDLADNSKADGRHWAWDSIDQVVKAGLFNGTSATTFAPQNPMTRAQFVVVITRLENTTRTASNKLNVERVPTQTRFTDVPTDMWCAGAVAWAEANGIVEGYSDNTFRPNQAISRAQIAAFVYRYVYNYKKYNLKTVLPEPAQFTDFSLASTVFQTAINYCRTHDLIRGYGDHTLRPNISVTRAQVAAILSRIIIIIQSSRGGSGGNNYAPAAQTAGVKLSIAGLAGAGSSTVSLQKLEGGAWVPAGSYTYNVNDQMADQGSTASAITYRVIVKPDTANGYEFESFTLTEDTTNELDNWNGVAYAVAKGSRVSDKTAGNTTAPNGRAYSQLTAADVAALNLGTGYQAGDYVGIYWFTVQPGGLADVDVQFKQYGGYALSALPSLGTEIGIFTTSKRSYSDSLVASLLLMNNNTTENSQTLDFNADNLVGEEEGLAKKILDDITGGLSIDVQGSVLDKILQESINSTLKDKEATLVEQVTGMANNAAPSNDWVTKVEDQITKALKTEVQNAGGTWQSDWRAVVNPDDVAKVTFQPTDASYTALTSTVLADINRQLANNTFQITAQTTAVDQGNGATLFYVKGAISGGPIVLNRINQNIYVQMLYSGTGVGPRYTVKTNNGTGTQVDDVVNPVTGATVFTFTGTISMASLNDAASKNPINIQYTPDPIQSSDIPSTAVEVKNFLTVDTLNRRFNSIINRLTDKGQDAAVTELKKIYDPANPTAGYVKITTVAKGGTGTDSNTQIIDTITLGSDTLLSVTNAPGSAAGKKDAVLINPRLANWVGAPKTVATRTPNATDLNDSNVYFDELGVRIDNVRKAFTPGFVLASLNNHPTKYTISCTTTGTAPSDAALRAAVATAAEMDNPTCADIFRALGPNAAGLTSITFTVSKTFNTSGQIGGAMDDTFGSSNVSFQFTITRYETLAQAVANVS